MRYLVEIEFEEPIPASLENAVVVVNSALKSHCEQTGRKISARIPESKWAICDPYGILEIFVSKEDAEAVVPCYGSMARIEPFDFSYPERSGNA